MHKNTQIHACILRDLSVGIPSKVTMAHQARSGSHEVRFMMDPARTEPASPSAMLVRHLGNIHTYIEVTYHTYTATYIHTYIQTMNVEYLLCMCAGWSSPASTYRPIVCWNSASWSPLHTMWTRMAKNRVLSSVQHNPLAHHREGEEEEEEGGVVARGFWNLLCIIIIIIMLHSIVSGEKVRSALDEHGARRRQAATQYPHPPNDDGMPWHHTIQLWYQSEANLCMYVCMYVWRIVWVYERNGLHPPVITSLRTLTQQNHLLYCKSRMTYTCMYVCMYVKYCIDMSILARQCTWILLRDRQCRRLLPPQNRMNEEALNNTNHHRMYVCMY